LSGAAPEASSTCPPTAAFCRQSATSFPPSPPDVNRASVAAAAPQVLAGEPDHRDELLSSAGHAAGRMLICLSRARGERLILEL
jgi:hypothetical protein